MKKALSFILAAIMIFTAVIPAFAINFPDYRIQYPCIYIHGNAGAIVDADENKVYPMSTGKDQILSICSAVLPKLGKGLLTGNYTEYYDSFEAEFIKLYDKCALDKEGNAKYGTQASKENRDALEADRHADKNNNGFGLMDYSIRVDWRLDPLYNADLLDAFIDDILAVTHKDKVCLASDCLGSVNIIAYLGKYGHDKIYGIGIVDPVGFGCELITDIFSGHVDLNPTAIERFANDKFITTAIPAEYMTLFDFISTTIELANDTGLLSGFSDIFMNALYKRLKDELVPRLTLASYGSWPAYWALVSPEKYQETKKFIFGEPGSKRYEEYAGLIEKLDEYDTLVRQKIPELLTSAKEDGVKIAIAAKYGFQFPCVIESTDRQSDVWVSLQSATLGATCAPIGQTLSDEYIAEREALGYGKYISPDKTVDMSTCLFPDNTWAIKNRIHNQAGIENQIISNVLACDNITIDNSAAPQFTVYIEDLKSCEPMTEENCHTESWYVSPAKEKKSLTNIIAKIRGFFNKIREWFILLRVLLTSSK